MKIDKTFVGITGGLLGGLAYLAVANVDGSLNPDSIFLNEDLAEVLVGTFIFAGAAVFYGINRALTPLLNSTKVILI